MIRRPPRSTLFPTRRSSDLGQVEVLVREHPVDEHRVALDDAERVAQVNRSEEHTSELQSRPHLVCRLLLEKKNKTEQKKPTQKNRHRKTRSQTIIRKRISKT